MTSLTQPATSTLVGTARPHVDEPSITLPTGQPPRVRLSTTLSMIALGILILGLLPGRSAIPPLVESDYCYLLTAADRMHDGSGLTAPLPRAPHQPWNWSTDWAFLTQWPIGYPMLVVLFRSLLGLETLEAAGWISVLACASAWVGWFLFVRRCLPRGWITTLLAGVAAATSVSTASLINPSTDAVVIAIVPFVLLGAIGAVESVATRRQTGGWIHTNLPFAWVGLAAGGLFWIRYASVFIPFAVGVYFIVEHLVRRRLSRLNIATFAVAACLPIATLLLLNRSLGASIPIQAQLNLGHALQPSFSFSVIAETWWNFTDFGFYNHLNISHWFFALWPLAATAATLVLVKDRAKVRIWATSPGVILGAMVMLSLLTMLVVATSLFGTKFNYVGLQRYYLPVKPLYFLLFVGPLFLVSRRWLKITTCLVLLLATSWMVQYEWPRPYVRWLDAQRASSPYGQWSRVFTPDAGLLYEWLELRHSASLVVVSNFPDYIALETGIPALPIPEDRRTLNRWVTDIRSARGVDEVTVLFVLDRTNLNRDYFLPPVDEVIRTFHLRDDEPATLGFGARVMHYDPS